MLRPKLELFEISGFKFPLKSILLILKSRIYAFLHILVLRPKLEVLEIKGLILPDTSTLVTLKSRI